MDDPSERAVMEFWDDVVADMEATVEEYRDEGWTALAVHPGDVSALPPDDSGDGWGLDVLVPDNEFAEVQGLVEEEGGAFDSCEVYRAAEGETVFAVVAMLEERRRNAILFPVYFHERAAAELLERAREAGEMRTHLRPLAGEPVVTFTQSDPSLFTS